MDQDNERLLDPDSNPDLEWWSDLDAPSAPASRSAGKAPAPTPPTTAPMPTPASPTNKATTAASTTESGKSTKGKPKSKTRKPKSAGAAAPTQPPVAAVIDRFEGKWAVLLVGEDEKVLNVPRSSLPKRVRAGHWLKIQQSEEDPENLISAEIDKGATDAARARIADKLAQLRSGDYLK